MKLIEILLPWNSTYHNHKETMAHVGIAVQIAFCTGILTLRSWPPNWVGEVSIFGVSFSPRFLSFFGFVLIWMLIHWFIRWQLRHRRFAAVWDYGLIRTLRKWTFESPSLDDITPYSQKKHKNVMKKFPKYSKLKIILDFFIPINILNSDETYYGLPVDLVKEIVDQAKFVFRSIEAEWFLTFGSFILLIIVFFVYC